VREGFGRPPKKEMEGFSYTGGRTIKGSPVQADMSIGVLGRENVTRGGRHNAKKRYTCLGGGRRTRAPGFSN